MSFFSKKSKDSEIDTPNEQVKDEDQLAAVTITNDKKVDERDFPLAIAQLRTANNRLLLIVIMMMVLLIIMTMYAWNRASKADKNQQLLYVQMWDSGENKVLEALPDDAVIVNKNIINSLLEKYIKLRHGQIPQSIIVDYDDATTFMSNNLYEYFIDKDGFDAPAKVKKMKDDLNKGVSETIEIAYRSEPEHYDAVDGSSLQGKETIIMRTNMYVTKTTRNAQGKVINVAYNIHRLQWHLMDKEELSKQDVNWIRVNPIGMVIIVDEVIVDKVATDKANIKNK